MPIFWGHPVYVLHFQRTRWDNSSLSIHYVGPTGTDRQWQILSLGQTSRMMSCQKLLKFPRRGQRTRRHATISCFAKKTDFRTNWLTPKVVQIQKAFSFRDSVTRGSVLGPRWGFRPWTQVGAVSSDLRYRIVPALTICLPNLWFWIRQYS